MGLRGGIVQKCRGDAHAQPLTNGFYVNEVDYDDSANRVLATYGK